MLSTVDNIVDAMLDDWAWYVRDRDGRGHRCASIEGRYRRDPVDDDARRTPKRMVDVQQCLQVERTVADPHFPRKGRILLVGWYVLRAPRHAIARHASIPVAELESECGSAARMVINRMRLTHMQNTSI